MILARTIGRRYVYISGAHTWARGMSVIVVAIHRGARILTTDDEIGHIRADDIVEFAPIILRPDGTERASWVTSDARAADLIPE